MHLLVEPNTAAVAATGARLLARALRRPEVRNLEPATGNSPQQMYALLPAALGDARAEVAARLTVFQMDEYLGLGENDDRSLYRWMVHGLTDPLGIARERVVPLLAPGVDPHRSCAEFDRRLYAAGGLDVLVAGLGLNGHLGFNEPLSPLDAPSRVVDLTAESVLSNAVYWGGIDRVPRQAATTGLAAMLAARAIVLVVTGTHKRAILEKTLTGPVTTAVPSSHLQTTPHTVVIADRAACPQQLETAFRTRSLTSSDALPALLRA
jgi:glucosamine-6-phosphate deaminase